MANKGLAGLAGLSAAIGLGLVIAGPKLMPQASSVDAAGIAADLDGHLRDIGSAMHARLDTLANLETLQASVSTDANTVRQQTSAEIAFKPKNGEVITIGQVVGNSPSVLLVLPAGSTPARNYETPGSRLQLAEGVLWLIEALPVSPKYPREDLRATLAISHPVDWKPLVDKLDARGVSVQLDVEGQKLVLGTQPIADTARLTPVPVTSEIGRQMKVSTALPVAAASIPFLPIGLGLLALAVVLGLLGVRGDTPATVTVTAAVDIPAGPVTPTSIRSAMPNSATSADQVDIGAVIENTYQITALLGEGGMGSVWQATHLRLPDKRVAIKFLKTDTSQLELLARFKREAEITSKLGHPNIIGVMDFNTLPSGSPYIVLEFLEGESLAARMSRGPMPLDEALAIARQIGSALHAAHRAGIVHRDLKPDNVFLVPTDGEGARIQVKVLDFGISKMRGNVGVQTQDSTILGTPQYMSPEQANGKNSEVDARSDIWSLAAIVHEMLAGAPAFQGESLTELLVNVLVTPSPSLKGTPNVTEAVSSALDRALTKDPGQRFPDVPSFISALTGAPLLTQTRAVVPEGI